MTEVYIDFLSHVHDFISGTDDADFFFEFVDDFWSQHESDLFRSEDNANLNDEQTIVSDVLELVDRYDSCNAIVEHDPYCINEETLRNMIGEMINRIDHPVYD